MLGATDLLATLCLLALARAHTVITYPGWRGNNLHTNGSDPSQNPDLLGIEQFSNGSLGFPWGMQWMYPCGGMPQSVNRTYWPVDGGAVSIQPGWFPGHSKALFYVNIGIQEGSETAPPNMSHPVVPPFQILGPSNNEYPGQFCLPQVPMPVNVTLQIGQKITLQVVEAAQHGAALYNCVDLELVDNNDPRIEPVNATNCYNSTDIAFELVFTTAALSNAASSSIPSPSMMPVLFTALVALAMAML